MYYGTKQLKKMWKMLLENIIFIDWKVDKLIIKLK